MFKAIFFIFSTLLYANYSQAALKSCIEEICGSGVNNEDIAEYQQRIMNSKNEASTKLQQTLKSTFLKLRPDARAQVEKEKDQLNKIDLKNLQDLSSEDQTLLVVIHQVIPAIGQLSARGLARPYLFSNLYISMEADIKKELLDSGFDEDLASSSTELLEAIRNSYEIQKILGLIFSSVPEYAITSFKSSASRTNFVNIHEALTEIYEKSSSSNSTFLRLSSENLLRLATSKSLDEQEVRQVNLLYGVMELFKLLKNDPKAEVQAFKNATENAKGVTLKLIEEKIQKRVDYIAGLKLSDEEFVERSKKAEAQCLQLATKTMNILPTTAMIKEFSAHWRDLKERSLKFVAQNVSYAFANGIKDRVERIQVDIPKTQESFSEDLVQTLENDMELVKQISVRDMALLTLININNELDDEMKELYPFHELSQSCGDDIKETAFYDYAVPTNMIDIPSIKISWSVMADFEKFQSVLTHEMGHQIYSLLRGSSGFGGNALHSPNSFEKVKEMISCVAQTHGKMNSEYDMWDSFGKYSKLEVSQYTVEDFADHFAAKLDSKTRYNMACVFPDQQDDDYPNLSLTNPMEYDTHSADSYRIINLEFLKKGQLPASCEEALLEEGILLKRCL